MKNDSSSKRSKIDFALEQQIGHYYSIFFGGGSTEV
jgi:hypothetical protein